MQSDTYLIYAEFGSLAVLLLMYFKTGKTYQLVTFFVCALLFTGLLFAEETKSTSEHLAEAAKEAAHGAADVAMGLAGGTSSPTYTLVQAVETGRRFSNALDHLKAAYESSQAPAEERVGTYDPERDYSSGN